MRVPICAYFQYRQQVCEGLAENEIVQRGRFINSNKDIRAKDISDNFPQKLIVTCMNFLVPNVNEG